MDPERFSEGKQTYEEISVEADGYRVLSDAIESLHQACMDESPEEFLFNSMRHFCRLLSAEYVIAGHRAPGALQAIQTDMVLHQGKIVPNFVYDVKGTPCEIVSDRLACVYPERVVELFPHDEFFKSHGIEGYVGVPIVDTKGNMLGLIVALTRKPVEDPQTAMTLAKLFAVVVSPAIPKVSHPR